MLHASVCHCFGYISVAKSVKNSVWNAFPTWLEVEGFFLDLEVTTNVLRYNSHEKLHDDHVSKRSLCIYMKNLKNLFIAEATFRNKTWKKGICQDTTPILGSSPSYRETRSHINRMIDSHWALKLIAIKCI